MTAVDSAELAVEGPWQHRFVAANGARFHVVVAGPDDRDAPLVVLLHDLLQYWWAWHHQLTDLAAAGYRVAAMDLRGTGGSDKPPHGYDTPTMATDVARVIRSLGADRCVLVGSGTGAGSHVSAYLGKNIARSGTPPTLLDFDAFPGDYTGGVYVG